MRQSADRASQLGSPTRCRRSCRLLPALASRPPSPRGDHRCGVLHSYYAAATSVPTFASSASHTPWRPHRVQQRPGMPCAAAWQPSRPHQFSCPRPWLSMRPCSAAAASSAGSSSEAAEQPSWAVLRITGDGRCLFRSLAQVRAVLEGRLVAAVWSVRSLDQVSVLRCCTAFDPACAHHLADRRAPTWRRKRTRLQAALLAAAAAATQAATARRRSCSCCPLARRPSGPTSCGKPCARSCSIAGKRGRARLAGLRPGAHASPWRMLSRCPAPAPGPLLSRVLPSQPPLQGGGVFFYRRGFRRLRGAHAGGAHLGR